MPIGPIVRIKGGLYRPNLNTVAGKSSGGGSSAPAPTTPNTFGSGKFGEAEYQADP